MSVSSTLAKIGAMVLPGTVMAQAKKAEIARPGCIATIFGYARIETRDGVCELYHPVSNRKIGWYNPSTGVGWCDAKGYEELKAYAQKEEEIENEFLDSYFGEEYSDDSI